MSLPLEALSAAESEALHAFHVTSDGSSTTVHATQAPYSTDKVPSLYESQATSTFEQMRLSAHFVQKNPRVGAFLAERGFQFALDKQADGGSIIDIVYPESTTSGDSKASVEYKPFQGESYKAYDFMKSLSEGKVLLSVSEEKNFEWHDSILHRPMWELVGTIPGLFPALCTKAARVVAAADALPPRDSNLFGPEDIDLARKRLHVTKDLGNYMGNIDFNISSGGVIATGISLGSAEHITMGLREIFSVPADVSSGKMTEPDPTISNEQIKAWAEQLSAFSGKFS